MPHQTGLPLSRLSTADLRRAAIDRGIVANIGQTTIWRWLSEDAIKPWTHRSWVFPRDPDFEAKAAPILDLYQGRWRRKPFSGNEFVISADEKPRIQCRLRTYPTTSMAPGWPMRIEHEYSREGTVNYLAAWDVHRAKVFGHCEPKSTIVSFERFVGQVMRRKPYRTAKRVFWIVDNASIHRGKASVERFRQQWPNSVLVHTPTHASWLNQVEIFFSIVQRKGPHPERLLGTRRHPFPSFQVRTLYYEDIARPFQWKFTRKDLKQLMKRLAVYEPRLASAA